MSLLYGPGFEISISYILYYPFKGMYCTNFDL